MSDAGLHQNGPEAAPSRLNGDGALRFPNKWTLWVDDELNAAVELGAATEREAKAAFIRRAVRWYVRQLGLMEANNGR
jgi:hypothetical protein